ncbi:thioesterase II family protein [Paenibacillus lutrae]|uniref:Alpha/beta fold hydrolase n=1 Tax=Paenibacillus lutrae TaxID=2078573 RepID=A0A7X3JY69_9BACL|nr:alpha/beta fold hydrolase [Paenibacillus lutrae]MVO98793.1 alpha/beta fold hydrolase [Paenibacillus lutrae]
MKLFCMPYSGASATIFTPWIKEASPQLQIEPVELPGRGRRFNSPLLDDMDELSEDVVNTIERSLQDAVPYALFGHSLGSHLAFEAAHRLIKRGQKPPRHVFFSGALPPNVERSCRINHEQSDPDLVRQLIDLGGLTDEVSENKDLMDIFLPIIRSDLKAVNTHRYADNPAPLALNISVIYGTEDELTTGDLGGYHKLTRQNCSMYPLEGGHFFIRDRTREILEIVRTELLQPVG